MLYSYQAISLHYFSQLGCQCFSSFVWYGSIANHVFGVLVEGKGKQGRTAGPRFVSKYGERRLALGATWYLFSDNSKPSLEVKKNTYKNMYVWLWRSHFCIASLRTAQLQKQTLFTSTSPTITTAQSVAMDQKTQSISSFDDLLTASCGNTLALIWDRTFKLCGI